jgi:DNA-binding response OmpR family regulator
VRAQFLYPFIYDLMKTSFKILIIDDEKDLCELVKLILKEPKFIIDCASNLKEGKRKWLAQVPAIVILDQNLPDGLGLEMVENASMLLNETKVIMVTADTQQKTKAGALAIGIDYFIQKPFSLRLIRELVQEIIAVNYER